MGLLDLPSLIFELGEGADALAAIQRLRYDVYVREFRFLDPSSAPGGGLKDVFDAQGLHAVARKGKELVGALRLALHSERGFPLQALVRTLHLPTAPERTGEISHLVIAKSFRRRKEDGLYGVEGYLRSSQGGVLPEDGPLTPVMRKRRAPVLILGLFRVVYQMSKRLGLDTWLMLAERRLQAALARYSIPFHQAADAPGGADNPRPCILSIREMEDRMRRLDEDYFQEFLKGLEPRYQPGKGGNE